MFNSKHYIPILKWKRAEQEALKALEEKEKDAMTPLIELVMPTVDPFYKKENKRVKKTQEEMLTGIVKKFKEERINKIPEELLQCWGLTSIFLDFTLLYEDQFTTQLKIDSLNKIIPIGSSLGLKIIPVLNLNDDKEIKKTICLLFEKYKQGICLRIMPSDLVDVEELNVKIKTFLSDYRLHRENIDLLIDIKDKESEKEGSQYLQFLAKSQKIEHLTEWRNFIFASGSFPEDLSGCRLDEPKFLPRLGWKNWLHVKSQKIVRTPNFADYTIRNPIFKDYLQYYSSTTSIKYTVNDDWLIMKGKVREYGLYLVNAKLLVEDTSYFYGENFSWGDKNIAQKAKHYYQYRKNPLIKGTGRAEDWIAWGINHHLMLVINQISSLP
ncbi:MAG: hypothetical protein WC938_00425 [Candidatus Paceibacterota bacterium]|jgi:hypothetical protein